LGRRRKRSGELDGRLQGLPVARCDGAPALGEEDEVAATGTMRQQILDPTNERFDVADGARLDHPFEAMRVAIPTDGIGWRQPGEEAQEGRRSASVGAVISAMGGPGP